VQPLVPPATRAVSLQLSMIQRSWR